MKNKIFFIIFMCVWIVLIGLNFIFPKVAFSEQENRYLAKIPSFSFEKLVSGEYQKDLESYINDHFIFRNAWIKLKSELEQLLGKTENNNVYIGKDGYLFEKFEYNLEQKNNMDNVASIVNNFASKTKVPIYFMLIPNSIYINQDKLPDNASTIDQNEIINSLYSNLDKNISTINVTQTMINNKNNYLYFKTDHHITSNGAYLVYNEFNNSRNVGVTSLKDYERIKVSDSFLGTFDSKAQILNQEADSITIYLNENNTKLNEVVYDNDTTKSIYNTEYLKTKDKYSFFLNGNNAKVVVKTNVKNNKKLLVVKDSYAHILVQFLCNDYEEIHLIDPRYYREALSNYVDGQGIDEILFLYNVSNLVNDLGIRNVR